MTMEGLYTASGEWAYSVSLPGKSGVGGGILAVRRAGSPSLPSRRRSICAYAGFGMMANAAGSIAHPTRTVPQALYPR